MPIAFACPNGHQLSASEDKAGKTAKCPKCGEPVVIPGGSSPSSKGIAEEAAGKSGVKNPAPLPPGHILFLCPNGHRLNGPASLAGKAGQCPHCGAKFRIPSLDEEPAPSDELEELSLAEDENLELEPLDEDLTIEDLPNDEYYDEEELQSESVDLGLEGVEPVAGYGQDDVPEGWGRLFPVLWREKSKGSEVDIFLADGTKLTPTWFSESHSRGDQGVFAVRDTEGAYTVMAIAWDSVIRADIRSVIDLPDSMFKE